MHGSAEPSKKPNQNEILDDAWNDAWKKGSNQIIPPKVVKDGDLAWKKEKKHLKQI